MARIGIDCRMYSSSFTGIGRYVFELVKHITQLDTHNQYVLFFNEPEFNSFVLPKRAMPPGGDTAEQKSHNSAPHIKKVLADAPYYSLREQTRYLKTLKQENLDLMHFTHFNAPLLYNRPSIVTIHDLTLSFFPGNKMNTPVHRVAYHTVLRNTVKKAKKVITVSSNTKKDLQKLLSTPEEKIEVIYLGVDKSFHKSSAEEINAVRKKLGLPQLSSTPPSFNSSINHNISEKNSPLPMNDPASYLLYTGVWRSHKNLQNLLRAFQLLKTKHGYPGKLVITGRHDPAYAPEIFDLTDHLNLTPHVLFPGLVEERDLPPLISGAAAYVFPSLYEGFGLPPLEAMACETPVAAARASSLPEVCGDDQNSPTALFFDPQNPKDMAQKIATILSDQTVDEKLVTNGLHHVQKFSWDKMAKKTLELYSQILS